MREVACRVRSFFYFGTDTHIFLDELFGFSSSLIFFFLHSNLIIAIFRPILLIIVFFVRFYTVVGSLVQVAVR